MMTLELDDLREVLKTNVRVRRGECDLTQQALADAVHVARPYIAQIESGARIPTMDVLVRLANVLRTTPDKLISPGTFSGSHA
jgi:transcriptional regulator with XRE-family HTH domain